MGKVDTIAFDKTGTLTFGKLEVSDIISFKEDLEDNMLLAMGSDIAVDAADIALMSDDIPKIPYLKRFSNATVRIIKFSISLSLFINFVAIILSFMGWLNPTTGALVHNGGSIFVVVIAALLYNKKFD